MSLIPTNITLAEWSQRLIDTYPEEQIPLLSSENAWQDWANSLRLVQLFAGALLADARQFADWREWAEQFNFSVG